MVFFPSSSRQSIGTYVKIYLLTLCLVKVTCNRRVWKVIWQSCVQGSFWPQHCVSSSVAIFLHICIYSFSHVLCAFSPSHQWNTNTCQTPALQFTGSSLHFKAWIKMVGALPFRQSSKVGKYPLWACKHISATWRNCQTFLAMRGMHSPQSA